MGLCKRAQSSRWPTSDRDSTSIRNLSERNRNGTLQACRIARAVGRNGTLQAPCAWSRTLQANAWRTEVNLTNKLHPLSTGLCKQSLYKEKKKDFNSLRLQSPV